MKLPNPENTLIYDKPIHQCILYIDIIDSNLEMGESHCILIQCNDTEEPYEKNCRKS